MKKIYKEGKIHNKKVFDSKELYRKIWAEKPIEEKLQALLKMQQILVDIKPE